MTTLNFNQKIVVAGWTTMAVQGDILERAERALTIAVRAIRRDRVWHPLPEETILVVKAHVVATEETS